MDGSEDGPSRTGQVPTALALVGALAPSTRIRRGRGRVAGVRTPVCYQRPGHLDSMSVQAVLKASSTSLGTLGPESLLFGYNDVEGGFEGLWFVRRLRWVESILPQVLVLRFIPICASAAWIRYSPRVWVSVISTIFQEPLDVGHKGRGEYSHVGCSASANELR
jgi:hypothetical protein